MSAIDLGKIYNLRNEFIVIGLTGRSGSGCSDVANMLSKGFDENLFPPPQSFENIRHNNERKYLITYNFAKAGNFKPFKVIEYKNVLAFLIMRFRFDRMITFLQYYDFTSDFKDLETKPDFSEEILKLKEIRVEYESIHNKVKVISPSEEFLGNNLDLLFSSFFGEEFNDFVSKFHNCFAAVSDVRRIKFLQIVANNLRKGNCPFCEDNLELTFVFRIAVFINYLIKSWRKNSGLDYCHIVIDSLRNPLEAMFFRERFSAFYLISVNSDSNDILKRLKIRFKDDFKDVLKIDLEEYTGKNGEFYKQDVKTCLQKADIHLHNIPSSEIEIRKSGDISSVYSSQNYSIEQQILTYICLILQPGIISPSPEERCMQIAYAAKLNSGCISRQVGAVITDKNFSIKAIGWNSVPQGQTPCLLRSTEMLKMHSKEECTCFSKFEKSDNEFVSAFDDYALLVDKNNQFLNGRNHSYCFKDIINSYKEGKNQVHTRSLHAEENAFLQLTKYGGGGIDGGCLFVTASPCELCSKKSYQLGIDKVYYIDPYPGISKQHIFECGDSAPKLKLFNGAVGNAYHWIYEPLMPYKDELSLLTGVQIKNENQKLKEEILALKEEKS